MIDTAERITTALAGRYLIERELGRGGMATVYLARDPETDRLVAVKVLHPELAASLGAERFLREITLGRSLQHPHIVGLLDSGEADDLLYYVMPYVDGESLRDRLERVRQLPIETAVAITRQVADALEYAHTRGVVHRDIKPENILLSGDDAMVADFGIARAVTAAGGEKLTQTGMAVGTPTYMSPEQAAGSHDVTPASDQYSLACVVYEMLAGQPPFTGSTPMAIMARHSLEEVPSIAIVRASIPPEVEDAVHRALEKVPADRFANVGAFATALTTPVRGRRRPKPRTSQDRIRARVRSGRLRRLAVAATVIALLGGGGAWGYLRQRSGDVATPEGADPRHIAVLYFDNVSGSSELRHLADGLTDALIHELSGVKTLQVISRFGVQPYRGGRAPPDSIARALKVGSLVEGTLAQHGDRLRVDVALVNPATGAEVGSTRIERPRSEIFALQDDLAKEVAIFLRRRLGEEVQLLGSRAGTRSAEAWELYQQAREVADGADTLRAAGDAAAADHEMIRADSMLARVEAMDEKWVRPIVDRGWLTYWRWRLSETWDEATVRDPFDTGMARAEQALRLAPRDPDALELRGTLRYYRWLGADLGADSAGAARLLADAERDLRASVAASPTQAQAWSTLSHLLLAKSQTAEGKLAAQRAYEADPYLSSANVIIWRLFTSSLDLENSSESARWCAEGEKRFPADARFKECRLWTFTLKGQQPDIEQAWKLAEDYVRLSPPDQQPYRRLHGRMIVAMALARAGLADSARAVAASSTGDPSLDPERELVYFDGIVQMLLGDREAAIDRLARYLATNPQQRASMARDDTWWFRDLRGDPRYRQLVGLSS